MRHTVQSRCPMIAPTVTPMGLYVAASVIVAICDRSPHSAPQPGHQLDACKAIKHHYMGHILPCNLRVRV